MSESKRHFIFSAEHRANISASKRLSKHPKWKGGRKRGNGYILIMSLNHPNRDINGYVYEHRLVMEAHLGRLLMPMEIVHHINGIRDDNRIENLRLFFGHKEHIALHNRTNNQMPRDIVTGRFRSKAVCS